MSFVSQTTNTPSIASASSRGSGCKEVARDFILVQKEMMGQPYKKGLGFPRSSGGRGHGGRNNKLLNEAMTFP